MPKRPKSSGPTEADVDGPDAAGKASGPAAPWRRWGTIVRSHEWLAVTFLPLFTSFYLILLSRTEGGGGSPWWSFLALLLFGYCCASFAFALNAWTDRSQDLSARKRFSVGGWRWVQVVVLLAGLTVGCVLALLLLVTEPRTFETQVASDRRTGLALWGSEALVVWSAGGGLDVEPSVLSLLLTAAPYLEHGTVLTLAGLAYLMAVVYSAPPLRLKERGWLGPLAIGVSEFALPQLLLFAALASLDVVAGLLAAVFGIAGLRMILLHQILDQANDSAAGVDTLAVKKGVEWVGRLVFGALFPLEVSMLLVTLWLLEPELPGTVALSVGSAVFFVLWSRVRAARAPARIPVFFTAPFDFYWFLWPMFLLVRGLGESLHFLPLLALHSWISRPAWSAYWEDLKTWPARAPS